MLNLVGNPENRFSQVAVHTLSCLYNMNMVFLSHVDIRCLANLSSIVLPI